jgi:FKBP-type peptidyl-prolyl cis-trans isomerase SlyD
MQISSQKVVVIDYTLTDDQNDVLDSSKDGDPLAYIQDMGNLIPGLENALEGKSAGDELSVSIQPDQAYGERDEALMQTVPLEHFEGVNDLQVGMQFRASAKEGEDEMVVTVIGIEDDQVTVDGNHPLAGQTLHFEVKIVEVREPSAEELEHGHVHGPGGHHH